MPKLDDSFMYLEIKMEEMMQFMEDAVHYTERSEGADAQKLLSWEGIHLDLPTTQSSASFVSAKLLTWSEIVPGNFTQW